MSNFSFANQHVANMSIFLLGRTPGLFYSLVFSHFAGATEELDTIQPPPVPPHTKSAKYITQA
jgi:hypothetical protein